MEKISIIVPVYNVEDYLKHCIESIIKQTYRNIEILLLDDGSTDNSGKICDEYELKDSRIKVIHKKNEGLSATRNLGIKICTGEYLSFIDSDDSVTEDYCETLYKSITENNADISSISYKVVRTNGDVILDATQNNGLEQNETTVYEGIEIIKELLKQNTIKNFAWNKLFKKSIISDFQVGVNYEDIVFSFEVLGKINRLAYTNKACYNYLKRNSSITATITEDNLVDFGTAIIGRYELVKNKYPELMDYNMYAFLESTLAISIKNVISERKFKRVEEDSIKFVNIIIDYVKENEGFFNLLNDYQKLCIYLMKYNIELYFSFLKERQKLKVEGKLK